MAQQTDQPQPHLKLEVLSQPRYLCGARELVSTVARRLGFDELSCSQIALAVDEALANVMRHGYGGRADGRVWISVWPLDACGGCDSGGIRIVIEDEAKQVEPDCIQGRDLDDVKPGGLGVHIIRHVMDVACYEKRECAGMRLTLQKMMGTAEASAAKMDGDAARAG